MTPSHSFRPGLPRLAALGLLAALCAGLALVPLPAAATPGTHLVVSSNAIGASQHIQVGLNKSVIVDLPLDVREVIVSQPSVAGAIMRTSRRAILQGVSAGETNIFFLDGAGNAISVIEVSVINDSSTLSATLNRVLPGSSITVESFGERVVLSGHVQSADDLDRAIAIAGQFTGSTESVASVVSVSGAQQVMLRVTVAEVSREAARQFGLNLSGSLSANGLATSLISNRANDAGSATGTGGPGEIGMSFDAGPVSIEATLRALESRNAVRLLAEPTLTAISGEPAEFLVGGEFPIQIRDQSGNTITEFKPFGVELAFTPTVRSNGVIGLLVDTSVSEIRSAEGALNVRSATTSVELPSGATLAIGGLIEERVRQQINQFPGLGNIPILGALFRSRDFVHSETELVILVTPFLVQPTTAHVPLPTDTMHFAGDAEAIFLGHMERLYGVGGGHAPGQIRGSVGFILD